MRSLLHIPRYTVEDYRQWKGDWELIDGLPYAMSPSPVRRHQQLLNLLTADIVFGLRKQKKPCGDCAVVSELDWIIDDETVLRPDIAIICNQSSDFITSPPVLIIEILSPATTFKDRHLKFDIYQAQGVKFYIIADADRKAFTIYQLTNKQYKEQKTVSSFIIHDKCKVLLDVAKAMAEIA